MNRLINIASPSLKLSFKVNELAHRAGAIDLSSPNVDRPCVGHNVELERNRPARAFFRGVVAVRRSKPLSQPRRESGVVPIERTATLRTVPGSAGIPPANSGRDARGPQNCSPEHGRHESLLR